MPSFKELAKSAHRTLCRCLATIILSFCGISSFGMISIKGILGLGTAATLSLAILTTLSTPAFADQTSKSLDVNLTLGNSISVRILDSTATSDLSLLSFDLTPTAAGVTSTKRAIVDVSTSNITGYKLYVEANGKDHNNQYTTDLVQGDTADSHVIPTSTSTASNLNFWNYTNPLTSSATVVPAHGNPDQIGMLMSPTTSTKANVDINVGVDTTITAGSYTNQLLFTAIANAESIDYTLYFDKNAPSGVDPSDIENFPVNQTASASATSYTFTIPDTAPTLVGYTFGNYVDPEAEEGEKGSRTNPYLPGDNVTVTADPTASVISGTKTLNAQWTIVSSTLTVDPNGGTWSGSTSTQTFPGDYGSTKVIGTPSANATYTISYNDNSQSATYNPNPPAPTSVSRPFTGWTLTATGGGSPSGSFDTTTNTYTYNIASDTLTAGYNSTSNTFTLPTVTKTGHTCTWHENSASGASHASGETNVTITANTEFYAVCAVNSHNVTVTAGTNIASTTGSGSHNYGSTVNIGATASTGYHFSSWTVNSGGVTINNNQFTMPDNDVSVTANGAINTCPITYNSNAPSGTTASGSMSDSSMTYNQAVTLTSNAFSITGYTFLGWAESASGSVVFANGATLTAAQTASYCGTHNTTKNLYAKWDNHYTLTVNPNGGTWSQSGFVNNQRTGTYNESIIISNPTAGPSYTISYDGNGQGASYTGSPTSVTRPFSSWSLSGSGTWVGSTNTFTYGAGAATLTASYSNTSNSFTLPAISKTGHSCKWAEGSASGTQYTGGTSRTITGNTTYYAVCAANNYTVNISNNNTTSGASSLSVPYGGSKTVTVTPSSGYYLSRVTCPSGYSCTGYSTGLDSTGQQTITVTNNDSISTTTITFYALPRPSLQGACVATANKGTFTYNSVEYIKLIGDFGATGACYTKSSQGTATFDNTASLCPSGTGVPSQSEFQSLINTYGEDEALYNTTGWSGNYWSSTPRASTNRAYYLHVDSVYAFIYSDTYRTGSLDVVCLVR